MSYAILRTRKLTTNGQLAGMQNHNDRKNNVMNADPELTKYNKTWSIDSQNQLRGAVEKRIEEAGAKVKGNSVRVIEHLITASPDFFAFEKKADQNGKVGLSGNVKAWNDFEKSSFSWLAKRYGKENVVHISVHFDEKTPHIHAYVVPVKEKQVKWKNKNGQGIKTVRSLSARDWLGGKDKMQQMQDSFHEAVKHLGLQRGQRNSPAKHEHIQKYYQRVNKAMSAEVFINDFKPNKVKEVSIPTPPMMGREDWKNELEAKFNRLLNDQQMIAIDQFKEAFQGQIEKALEFERIERDLKHQRDVLRQEVGLTKGVLSKRDKQLSDALKSIAEEKEKVQSWKYAAKRALIDKDPEAIQQIMNVINPRDRGMSR